MFKGILRRLKQGAFFLLLVLFTFFVFCLFLLLFWSLVCFVASDFLTICHLAIVNVCVIIILSIGNTQISILLLCFLYLFDVTKMSLASRIGRQVDLFCMQVTEEKHVDCNNFCH